MAKSNVAFDALDLPTKVALEKKGADASRESAAGEYLACLFLLLTDK